MEPMIKIFLDPNGKVTMNGTCDDHGLNLQVLLKCAEAVGVQLAQESSPIRRALSIEIPPGRPS